MLLNGRQARDLRTSGRLKKRHREPKRQREYTVGNARAGEKMRICNTRLPAGAMTLCFGLPERPGPHLEPFSNGAFVIAAGFLCAKSIFSTDCMATKLYCCQHWTNDIIVVHRCDSFIVLSAVLEYFLSVLQNILQNDLVQG